MKYNGIPTQKQQSFWTLFSKIQDTGLSRTEACDAIGMFNTTYRAWRDEGKLSYRTGRLILATYKKLGMC